MKIPGSDGFTGDFFQTCENNKTQILQKLHQKLEQEGRLFILFNEDQKIDRVMSKRKIISQSLYKYSTHELETIWV